MITKDQIANLTNEALADSVELRSEGWLVLFRTYDPKV